MTPRAREVLDDMIVRRTLSDYWARVAEFMAAQRRVVKA